MQISKSIPMPKELKSLWKAFSSPRFQTYCVLAFFFYSTECLSITLILDTTAILSTLIADPSSPTPGLKIPDPALTSLYSIIGVFYLVVLLLLLCVELHRDLPKDVAE